MSCRELRVVDLYSGIGGLHTALCSALCRLKKPAAVTATATATVESGRGERGASAVSKYKIEDVCAFDVNVVANSVYEHNFKIKPSTRGIDALAASHVRGSNLWLMSPPCQPYTRIGKQRDVEDARAASFLHMIDLLDRIEEPPEFLFLENVKNFEHSETRARLMAVLQRRDYNVQEFLVSPTQLGIPNTRLRYYLLARRRHVESDSAEQPVHPQTSATASSVQHTLPPLPAPLLQGHDTACAMRRMREFLDTSLGQKEVEELMLSPETLKRAGDFRFDVVTQASRASTTFAKGYGVKGHFRGSGPVLLLNPNDLSPAATDPHLHGPREAATHQHSTPEKSAKEMTEEQQPHECQPKAASTCSTQDTTTADAKQGRRRRLVSSPPPKHAARRVDDHDDDADAGADADEDVDNAGIHESTPSSKRPHVGAAHVPKTAGEERVFRALQPTERARLFSVREMLRLHGYPATFAMPQSVTQRKGRALVGNSVNVEVVAHLLVHLLHTMAAASTSA